MPLHKIEKDHNKLHAIVPGSFVDERYRERQDLQPLLRDNPESLDPKLFIVSEEFSDWEDSSRRVDLLGLDKDGNLIVIELKRVKEGGHMELQSIRYAAMLSAMDFEAVVRAHEQFLLDKKKDTTTDARQSLRSFLELDDSDEAIISNTPRIILIAPSFSREITTTVLWLNDQGLNIRCVEANIYNLDDNHYLDINQVIPLPSANDYQVKIREKTIKAEREAAIKHGGHRLDVLIANGILREGTRIHLIRPPRPNLVITDEKAKHATFLGTKSLGFRWDYDGEAYALSPLCRKICEEFGGAVLKGSFDGPDYWAIDGESDSLVKRARALLATDTDE